MPRLEKWWLQTFSDGEKCLHGEVYSDNRFEDGTCIRTSLLTELNIGLKYAQTLNTKYELGEKYE